MVVADQDVERHVGRYGVEKSRSVVDRSASASVFPIVEYDGQPLRAEQEM